MVRVGQFIVLVLLPFLKLQKEKAVLRSLSGCV